MPRVMLLVVEQSWRGRFISTALSCGPGEGTLSQAVLPRARAVYEELWQLLPLHIPLPFFFIPSLEILIDKKSCPGVVVKFVM